MTDWLDLTRRASFESHRLIGWIFWDPTAKDNLAALGVPDGLGHYIVNRGAPLCPAGPEALFAAYYTIRREFVTFAWNHTAQHVSGWNDVTRARDAAVLSGLNRLAPEIIEPLGEFADELWRTVDELPASGRVLFRPIKRGHGQNTQPSVHGMLSTPFVNGVAIHTLEFLSLKTSELLKQVFFMMRGWVIRRNGFHEAEVQTTNQFLQHLRILRRADL